MTEYNYIREKMELKLKQLSTILANVSSFKEIKANQLATNDSDKYQINEEACKLYTLIFSGCTIFER